MYCNKCGEKNQESSQFCKSCGTKFEHTLKNNNNKKPFWLFWWLVDENELSKQLTNYNTLKITQSARGISALLLILSMVVTVGMIFLNLLDYWSYFDVLLMGILTFFVYRGKKWAIILAMILWTLEKALLIISPLSLTGNSFNAFTLIMQIIWWVFYMKYFYLAYRVEKARKDQI